MTPLDAPNTLPPLRRIGPGVAGLLSLAIFMTLPLLPFGYIGNEEKEKEIGKYDGEQGPGREHLVSSVPSVR